MAGVVRRFVSGTGGEAGWLRRTFGGPDPDNPEDAGWFAPVEEMGHRDLFERWLLRRWLREVRSEEFRASAEYHYLVAEWESER